MIRYAKINNEETKTVDVGLGTNEEFYRSIGMERMDVEQAYNEEWYVKGFAPQEPHNDIIKRKIEELEATITQRNLRSAIQGDEFALNKINKVEAEIEELRHQLEMLERGE